MEQWTFSYDYFPNIKVTYLAQDFGLWIIVNSHDKIYFFGEFTWECVSSNKSEKNSCEKSFLGEKNKRPRTLIKKMFQKEIFQRRIRLGIVSNTFWIVVLNNLAYLIVLTLFDRTFFDRITLLPYNEEKIFFSKYSIFGSNQP